MEKIAPRLEINILDKFNIHDFTGPINIRDCILDRMTLAHKSDLIRTKLLLEYGGVWIDPTCFPLKKIDD